MQLTKGGKGRRHSLKADVDVLCTKCKGCFGYQSHVIVTHTQQAKLQRMYTCAGCGGIRIKHALHVQPAGCQFPVSVPTAHHTIVGV